MLVALVVDSPQRLSLRMLTRDVNRRAVMIFFSFLIFFVCRDAELVTLTTINGPLEESLVVARGVEPCKSVLMFGPPMLLDMSKTGRALDVADAYTTGLSCKSPRQELIWVKSVVPCLSEPFSFD